MLWINGFEREWIQAHHLEKKKMNNPESKFGLLIVWVTTENIFVGNKIWSRFEMKTFSLKQTIPKYDNEKDSFIKNLTIRFAQYFQKITWKLQQVFWKW